MFLQWSDDDIQHLYHTLLTVPASQPAWGGQPQPAGQSGFGARTGISREHTECGELSRTNGCNNR